MPACRCCRARPDSGGLARLRRPVDAHERHLLPHGDTRLGMVSTASRTVCRRSPAARTASPASSDRPSSEYWTFYYFIVGDVHPHDPPTVVVGRSPFGASLRGIRDSETRMRSLGYSVSSYKLAAFMMSGTLAGFAGLLSVWHTHFVSPSAAGVHRSVLLIVMVILGGAGTDFGPLVGAAVVVLVENVLSNTWNAGRRFSDSSSSSSSCSPAQESSAASRSSIRRMGTTTAPGDDRRTKPAPRHDRNHHRESNHTAGKELP